MENYNILDIKGNPVLAKLIFAFTVLETGKNYVALDNNDSVFSKDSAYNNLDIFEVVKEDKNTYYISNIPDSDWEAVKDTMIKELFSKIKI